MEARIIRSAAMALFGITVFFSYSIDGLAQPEPNSNRGVRAYDAGEYHEAIGHFRAHLRIHPGCSVALGNIGRCNFKLEDYAEAASYFDTALRNDRYEDIIGKGRKKQRGWDYAGRAESHYNMRKYRRAAQDFERHLQVITTDAENYYLYGMALRNSGQYSPAAKAFSQAMKLEHPEPWQVVVDRGRTYACLGQTERALEHCSEAIRLRPSNSLAYALRAIILLASGRGDLAAEDAEVDLDRQGKLDPASQHMAIYGYLGYRQVGSEADAESILDNVARRCDHSKWPYPLIGYLRGEISGRALTDAASNIEQTTEVQVVVGLRKVIDQPSAKGQAHLDWAAKHGDRNMGEVDLADAELAHKVFSEPVLRWSAGYRGDVQSFHVPRIGQRPYAGRPVAYSPRLELGPPPKAPSPVESVPLMKP